MSSNEGAKKREAKNGGGGGVGNKKKKPRSAATASAEREELRAITGYTPLTMTDIHKCIADLCLKLPPIPEGGFLLNTPDEKPATLSAVAPQATVPCNVDKVALRAWAATTQAVIEEYSFVVSNASVATYKWGSDRSGAADQNLGLLGNELARTQEMFTSRVSPRLNDVLCPVVTTLAERTVTTKKEDGTEVKQNFYVHSYEDVDYVQMCYNSLGRNAQHLRHLLLANFDKVMNAIDDYSLAQSKDNDSSRGLY